MYKEKYICDIFTFKATNVQNVQQQCIVDNDVQQLVRRSVLLLMEQQHTQFQFHASGLAVYVLLKCKQHSLEQHTGKKSNGVRSGDLGGYSTFYLLLTQFLPLHNLLPST
jgi:hypothetical protein